MRKLATTIAVGPFKHNATATPNSDIQGTGLLPSFPSPCPRRHGSLLPRWTGTQGRSIRPTFSYTAAAMAVRWCCCTASAWTGISGTCSIRSPDRFELIAYSFPGHHETPLPKGPYGEAELVEQLHALLKREGIAPGEHRRHLDGRRRWRRRSPAPTRDGRPGDPVRLHAALYRRGARQLAGASRMARKNGVKSLIPMLEKVFFTKASSTRTAPTSAT